jgi:hypothetical protein
MDKPTYLEKLDSLLSDTNKFKKLRKDPTDDVRKNISKLIDTNNAVQDSYKLKKLEGHYEPGYVYGNPKIHKNSDDPSLRPIISQIGTPVYDLAKELNSVIVRYMPKKYMVDSTYEFVEICRSIDNPKFLASLDVESLFTNVPVLETIDIILSNVYETPEVKAPSIPRNILRELLTICTTKCPFRHPNGQLYLQCDGVSMGSPLGPTFANYYMCNLENDALETLENKPIIYCRYVDDCFIMINNISELHSLKNHLEQNSVLTFTFELEIQKKLPFLDVLMTRTSDAINRGVYSKPSSGGECLNFESLCPLRYKKAVIRAFTHRAFTITNTWPSFHNEINRIKQLLTNNNYPISLIDCELKSFLDRKLDQEVNEPTNRRVREQLPNGQPENEQLVSYPLTNSQPRAQIGETRTIQIFYRNQYTSSAKTEEQILNKILHKNVVPTNPSEIIKLQIYYRNKKLRSLFIKNKTWKSEASDRVVYQYSCNQGGCNSSAYIGYTVCSLAKRFYMHVQSGAIRSHNQTCHSKKLFTKELLQSTIVLYKGKSKYDLTIAEALCIKLNKPRINLQDEGYIRVLRIF